MGELANIAAEDVAMRQAEDYYNGYPGECGEPDPPIPEDPLLNTVGVFSLEDLDADIRKTSLLLDSVILKNTEEELIRHKDVALQTGGENKGQLPTWRRKILNRIKTCTIMAGIARHYIKYNSISVKQRAIVDTNWIGGAYKYLKDIDSNGTKVPKVLDDHSECLQKLLRVKFGTHYSSNSML